MAAYMRKSYFRNFRYFHQFSARYMSVQTPYVTDIKPGSQAVEKINMFMKWYEDVIGLTEVREAQNKVIEAEVEFVHVQSDRQDQQHLLNELQTKIRDVTAELDRLNRGDPLFLETITKQHAMFRQEMVLLEKYKNLEKDERSKFGILSAAVRESHEKERQRTERTKYWSVIGSVVGALIGICGATLNSYLRNREIKKLSQTVKTQHSEIESILLDFKAGKTKHTEAAITAKDENGDSVLNILKTMKTRDENVTVQLGDIKQLILSQNRSLGEGTVVYVGPEIEGLLEGLADDLEYKIKINSLATVAFIYGAFAVSIPILYAIFSGGG